MENRAVTEVDESKLEAKDFVFYLEKDQEDGDTYAFFCPLSYFRENSQMPEAVYDALDALVPVDMDEMQNNCYATSRSLEEVEQELLSLGFVQDEEFEQFMSNLDGIVEESETTALTGS
jgi:hypothetical protein